MGVVHHRGALLADGYVDGRNLICGVHGWDYRYDTGVSEYNNDEALQRFGAVVDEEADAVWVDEAEVAAFAEAHPQPYRRAEYLGLYQDVHGARRNRTTATSRASRETGYPSSVTTERCRRWGSRSTSYRAGTTCNCSLRSWPDAPRSMTSPQALSS